MATAQQILDEARASLLRIMKTDAREWGEGQTGQSAKQLEIDKLDAIIDKYEARVSAAAGRRIVQPITRTPL